jgi:phosphoserine phosphatase RsbU/P
VANSARQKKHLRLYTEQPPRPIRPPIETVGCLPGLLRTFQTATGWTLRRAPQRAEEETGSGQWAVGSGLTIASPKSEISDPPSAFSPPQVPRPSAEALAGSIADLLGDLFETRHALRRCEAELAAGVPMVPHRDEEKHLAERLEAALQAGAEAIGCDAAALYLLDEATTELRLRSLWGLPFDRMTAPARPLQGAVADLEALLGHAVVLNDDALMATWNVPEDFPAAVCVPVSTPTTLLGTLWVFSNENRDFNDRETNILEVVAGRLASDLEREMLLRAGVDGAKLQKQVAAAERMQRNELPTIAPLLDGWDLAGWTAQADNVGGAFHDWFCLPDGLLAVAVGRAAEQGIAGALTANALKTAVRCHAQYHCQAESVLPQVNLTLWTGSAGDRRAALLFGSIETATGRVCCSSAGQPSVMLLNGDGWRSLSRSSIGLGESPEAGFEQFGCELQPGEALAVFTDSFRDAADGQNRVLGEAGVAEALQGKLGLSAAELVAAAQTVLEAHAASERQDRSILVVRRTMA